MFYLTTHSTHFIYGYMASDIWLRTILIVRKETRCRHIGYSYRLAARVLLYAPSHRQDNTYHGLVTPVVEHWLEREIAQWVNQLPIPFLLLKRSAVHALWKMFNMRSHEFCAIYRCAVRTPKLDLAPASAPRLCTKWRDMCYHVCGMMHIKELLLLIGDPCLDTLDRVAGLWFRGGRV